MPAPPASNLTNIAARAEVFPSGLHGDSGIPEIGDLVTAQDLVTPMGVEFDGETDQLCLSAKDAKNTRGHAEIH